MNKVQRTELRHVRSSFGERFAFARWWQTGTSLSETDGQFVAALGYRSKSTATNWRGMEEPLPSDTCAKIAQRTGVDADWLELGHRGSAPEPEAFAGWLRAYRKGQAANVLEEATPEEAIPEDALPGDATPRERGA